MRSVTMYPFKINVKGFFLYIDKLCNHEFQMCCDSSSIFRTQISCMRQAKKTAKVLHTHTHTSTLYHHFTALALTLTRFLFDSFTLFLSWFASIFAYCFSCCHVLLRPCRCLVVYAFCRFYATHETNALFVSSLSLSSPCCVTSQVTTPLVCTHALFHPSIIHKYIYRGNWNAIRQFHTR